MAIVPRTRGGVHETPSIHDPQPICSWISFIGVAFAAERASTNAWDSGILGLTLLGLLTAVLLAHPPDRSTAGLLAGVRPVRLGLPRRQPDPADRVQAANKTMGLAFIDSTIPGREIAISAVFAYTNTASTNPAQVLSPSRHRPARWSRTSPGKLRRVWDSWSGTVLAGPSGEDRELRPHRPLAPGPAAGAHRRSSVSLSVPHRPAARR